jgi:hypothetical protein
MGDYIQYLEVLLTLAFYRLHVYFHELAAFLSRLPDWLNPLKYIPFWNNTFSACRYIDFLLRRFTNVCKRNPGWTVDWALGIFQAFQCGHVLHIIFIIHHKPLMLRNEDILRLDHVSNIHIFVSVVIATISLHDVWADPQLMDRRDHVIVTSVRFPVLAFHICLAYSAMHGISHGDFANRGAMRQ